MECQSAHPIMRAKSRAYPHGLTHLSSRRSDSCRRLSGEAVRPAHPLIGLLPDPRNGILVSPAAAGKG